MKLLRDAGVLAAKDLRVEFRARRTLAHIGVLGVLIIVVLAMGLGPSGGPGAAAPGTVLWIAYLFGGSLCFERTMAVERQDDALASLLMAPVDRASIFGGKLAANLVLMLALALVVTPVGVVLFGLDLSRAPVAFASITALGLLGFAAVGTLFSGLAASTRPQGGLVSMLVFPLSLPVVLASTRTLDGLLSSGAAPSSGVPVLVAFDVLFLIAGWLAFELVLEP